MCINLPKIYFFWLFIVCSNSVGWGGNKQPLNICRVLKDDQFYFVLTTAIEGIVNLLPGPTAPAGNSQTEEERGSCAQGSRLPAPKGRGWKAEVEIRPGAKRGGWRGKWGLKIPGKLQSVSSPHQPQCSIQQKLSKQRTLLLNMQIW